MGLKRRLGHEPGTVLFACSICGIPYRYPTEMRLCTDKLFRCYRCKETETPLDYARKQGQGVQRPDQIAPKFTIGVKPDWYP